MFTPRIVRSRKMPGNGTSGAFVRQLDEHEDGEQGDRETEQHQRLGGRPAGVVGVHERVDEQRQAGGDGDGARDVEVARAVVTRLGQQARGEQRRGDADRHVDEQHPLPAGPLGEHAAEQHARGAAGTGDRAPDAERLVAFSTLGEHRGHERERGRGEQRGAEALDGAGDDQLDVGLGEAAGERCAREHDQADDEHAAPAEQVGDATAEQQEAAEGQRVRVDDPRQVVLAEVQRRRRSRAARR